MQLLDKMENNPKTDKVGGLEEEALKRKERLKALKRKVEVAENNEDGNKVDSVSKPIFRNYTPENPDALPNTVIEKAEPGDLEAEVKTQLESMKTPIVIEEIDIVNLAPRKPDWDLKRDVSKKLEKLERRTQKAIAELIRERLKNDQDNILQAVNVGTSVKVGQASTEVDSD